MIGAAMVFAAATGGSQATPAVSPGQPVGAILLLALAFVAIEFVLSRLAAHDNGNSDDGYDAKETAASVGVAIGDIVIRKLGAGLVALPFLAAYELRVADIPLTTLGSWLALFLAVDFVYYWFHRAAHRIRWFWATHAVHHSATRFNLSAAVRLGWTGQLSGAFVFFLPLALVGFHPLAIAAMLGASLLYQFFLHTRFDVSLGPLEWVLNTPRHHRVHHACNDACLDRNYGSVLIIWDRMFGTFAAAPAGEPLQFGLKGVPATNNVLSIAFGEWGRLFGDLRRAGSINERLRVLFGPPR